LGMLILLARGDWVNGTYTCIALTNLFCAFNADNNLYLRR
jgi:hypothetical protein